MLKRLFWLVMGAGFGFGMAFWLTRLVRSTVERYSPDNLSAELARLVQGLGEDLRAAAREGREAMRQREAELRERVETAPPR